MKYRTYLRIKIWKDQALNREIIQQRSAVGNRCCLQLHLPWWEPKEEVVAAENVDESGTRPYSTTKEVEELLMKNGTLWAQGAIFCSRDTGIWRTAQKRWVWGRRKLWWTTHHVILIGLLCFQILSKVGWLCRVWVILCSCFWQWLIWEGKSPYYLLRTAQKAVMKCKCVRSWLFWLKNFGVRPRWTKSENLCSRRTSHALRYPQASRLYHS